MSNNGQAAGSGDEMVPLTSRCRRSEMEQIDIGAAFARKTRSQFILDATLEATRREFEKHGLEFPSHSEVDIGA